MVHSPLLCMMLIIDVDETSAKKNPKHCVVLLKGKIMMIYKYFARLMLIFCGKSFYKKEKRACRIIKRKMRLIDNFDEIPSYY